VVNNSSLGVIAMKKYLLFIFLLFPTLMRAQNSPEWGIDSVNKTSWNLYVSIMYVDSLGNYTEPSDFERVEYSTDYPDKLVVYFEDNPNQPNCVIYNTPSQCIKKIKFTGAYSLKTENGTPPDSIMTTDMRCVDSIYSINQESFKMVTICLKNEQAYLNRVNNPDTDYWLMRQSFFVDGKKNGVEMEYYKIQELEGLCIVDNFRLKCKGGWKNDEKHGKWTYYSKLGQLILTEIYKNGKLMSKK
jgi:hypothetical protein